MFESKLKAKWFDSRHLTRYNLIASQNSLAALRGPLFHGNLMTKPVEPIIEMRDVAKIYSTEAGDFNALNGVNLQVNPGEFLGVVGKSGAGKSTFLNMITGVDHLSGGEVIVRTDDEVSVHKLDEDELALWRGKNLGIIFQSFQLLPMLTLIENVMMPMDLCGSYQRRASRERAIELLSLVELDDQSHKLPSQISGGQQQRVAIARALANDPPILVADEPTGNLDSTTADHIFDVFEHLVQDRGKTIIMVTHDNSLGPRFTRHIQIVDGELVHLAEADKKSGTKRRKK
jgi:putative ABC transport system ATP-binding protein